MYQWLNMAQYRVYDMCRVYVCIKVYKLCINVEYNTVYTTCAGCMSDV